MNVSWTKVVKIIGVINMILGSFIIYEIVDLIFDFHDRFNKPLDQNFNSSLNVSYLSLTLHSLFPLMLGFCLVVSGILIFIKKSFGWILGVVGWVTFTLNILKYSITTSRDVTTTFLFEVSPLLIAVPLITFSLFMLATMASKQIQAQFNVNKLSWALVSVIVFILFTISYLL